MALDRNLFKQASSEANKQADQFGADLGPGQYIMDLTSCKMAVSKSKNEMVSMEFSVVEPENMAGKKHWEHSVLTNKTGLSFLFQRLRALGYDTTSINSPESLIEHVDDVNANQYRVAALITMRNDGKGTNFKIEAVIPASSEARPASSEPTKAIPSSTPAEIVPEDPMPESEDPTPDPEPEPEGQDLQVGMRVKFSYKGVEIIGTVEALDEKANTVSIKGAKGVYKVTPDSIVALL